MTMDFYTEEGERSALQSEIEINTPEGYIGTKLMPVVPVTEKAGSMAYATVTAETAAQTGRVAGAAPSATQISNSAHAWACTEIIERAAITPDEVKQMGGIDKADKIGFRWAMRSVLKAREALIAAVVCGTKDATFDPAKLRTQVQTALQALRLYPGRAVLVSGTMTLKALVQQIVGSDIGPAFARIVTGANAAEAVLGLSIKAWLQGLAMFVGVDEVMAGDDDVWSVAGGTAEKFSIVKVDNTNDPLSHKYIPILGKTITFLPEGTLGWELQSIADRTLINNFYDAKMWIDVETYNSAAVYTFDGVAA